MNHPGSKAYYAALGRDAEREKMSEAKVKVSFRDGKFDANYAVYISGPMRGKPELNRHAFNAVQRSAVERGWRTFNPATKVNTGEHSTATPYNIAIREDIGMLLKSNGIVLLPGWRQSEGARFETEVAKALGLDFYQASEVTGPFQDGTLYIITRVSVPESGAEGIDAEARRLVYGDRAATYGHPRGDFDRVAKMWGAILNTTVTAEQVAIMMVAFKLARLSQTPTHHDSQVDTIGYMLCLARLLEDPTETDAWAKGVEAAGLEAIAKAVHAGEQPKFPTVKDTVDAQHDWEKHRDEVAKVRRSGFHPQEQGPFPFTHEVTQMGDHEQTFARGGYVGWVDEDQWAGAGFTKPYDASADYDLTPKGEAELDNKDGAE
jgi:hypothetical protein